MKDEITYTVTVKLIGEEIFFGPGVIELLQNIEEKGSLKAGAQAMKMSYNKAWRIINKAEKNLGFELIHSNTGGLNGGGSSLTENGVRLKNNYLLFQAKVNQYAAEEFTKIFS